MAKYTFYVAADASRKLFAGVTVEVDVSLGLLEESTNRPLTLVYREDGLTSSEAETCHKKFLKMNRISRWKFIVSKMRSVLDQLDRRYRPATSKDNPDDRYKGDDYGMGRTADLVPPTKPLIGSNAKEFPVDELDEAELEMLFDDQWGTGGAALAPLG